MITTPLHILLADDDTDDCIFFKAALAKSNVATHLITVNDGEQLMELLLDETTVIPDVLFLDLNMPRKNGFECLSEIKQTEKLDALRVIIFSTSLEQRIVDSLYTNGAQYYMRKPPEFAQLILIVHQMLLLVQQGNHAQPAREGFVLTA